MAKIEFIKPATKDSPASTETLEARVWAPAGTQQQPFYIGSGANFQANGTSWLEISYRVEDAQIFYTRNFLHHSYHSTAEATLSREKQLDEMVEKGEGSFGFGDMLPDTSLTLSLEKASYEDGHDEVQHYIRIKFDISIDTGAVFGHTGPGSRSVHFTTDALELEEGVNFMRELLHEMAAAQQGRHPDPASFPPGSSEWPLVWQLNRQAYNRISSDYQETYFENPALAEAFDTWLAQIPAGGKILDAGCGHGDPVIGRLLEKGFQVTGSDFSPEMLRRASQQFPQVTFIQQATTALTQQAAFDGACSFSSLLYMDPIDFLNSTCRLWNALKPGGLLFLYAFDNGPDWRGQPYHHVIGQWMWAWHYGIEEAAGLLEEHGYFEVLDARKVQVDAGEAERIAKELKKQKKEEKKFLRRQAQHPESFQFPFFGTPIERSPYAYAIIARRCERTAGA